MRDYDNSDRVRDPVPSWDDRSNHDYPDYDPDGMLDRWLLWLALLGCLALILIGAFFGALIFSFLLA